MAIESIHTYFNAKYFNIYKQMEQIFTNTEQNIDIKTTQSYVKKILLPKLDVIKNMITT